MTENIKKLLEIISSDEEAVKTMNALPTMEDVIAFAKEKGVTLTEADFQKPEGELNEDELEAVAGGKECWCSFGGGGTADEYYYYRGLSSPHQSTCACVVAGVGKKNWGTDIRCACAFFGAGD